MRTNTTEPTRGGWVKRAVGALAGVLLAAVPALALSTLAPDFVPSQNSGHEFAGSANPLTFNAPTDSLERLRSAEAEEGRAGRQEQPLTLRDWKFTGNNNDQGGNNNDQGDNNNDQGGKKPPKSPHK